jgi:hypothetical protein
MDNKAQDVWFDGTTESGIINFQRNEARSCTAYIKCYVVEFDSAEVRVQQGEFTSLVGGTTTAYNTTVSGFDQTKTAMVHYWWTTSAEQFWPAHAVRGRVSANGYQVDMYRNRNNGSVSGHYHLFEDISAGNDHFVVDHQSKQMTAASVDFYVTESRRDPTRTFILGSFACNNTSIGDNDKQTIRIYMYFNGSTRCDRASSTSDVWCSIQHVTFQDTSKVYVMFQHYTSFNATTITQNWTRPCNLEMSMVTPTTPMGILRGSSTSAAELDSLWSSAKLNSSTQAQFQRNSYSYSAYFGYSVIDWGGSPVSTGSNPSPMDPTLSPVKSVENFRISVTGYWHYQTFTKGQVVENCALFVTCRNSGGSDELREALHDVFIREPGIVVVHRTDAGGAGVVDVSVVEFYPDQVKVQSGKFRLWSEGTNVATLDTPVSDLTKAFLLAKWETNEATYWNRVNIRCRFTSTSEVEFYRNNTGNVVYGTYFVIEDLADYFRVQHYTASTTTTSRAYYAPEYSPYYSNLPLCSFSTSSSTDDVDDSTARVYAVGGGRLIQQRHAVGGTHYVAFQWVRFLDERIHTQPFASSFTTQTVNTSNLSDWHIPEKDNLTMYSPMLSNLGRGTTTAAVGRRTVYHNYRLTTDNTVMEMSREYATYTMYPSYGGPINWIGYTHPDADENHEIEYAYPTKSLVRSVEKFTYTGTTHYLVKFLSKGQRPENCVPFPSLSTAATDGEVVRLLRFCNIDQNSKVVYVADTGPSGGNVDVCNYIVEFDPDQVRVQKIWYMMTGTSVDVTIPQEINLAKTFLVFGYSADNYGNRFDYNCLTGEFVDSTTLRFSRYASSGGVYIVAYLVECLQDQWVARRDTDGSVGGTNTQSYIDYAHGVRGRFIQGSYSTDASTDDVDNGTFRLYPRQDHGFEWNRASTSYSIQRRHVEVVDFNPDLGIRIGGYWTDLNTASETKGTVAGPIDLERSMVASTIAGNWNRANSTAASYVSHINVRFELTDASTITCSRHHVDGNWSYGWFQWVEWPEYKSHYFEGIVTEKNVPIKRTVSCFRADTNELMDSTVSASGTGFYHVETTYSGVHYIVCQDDDPPIDYNHLIWGDMEPYPLPTFSGGEIVYG